MNFTSAISPPKDFTFGFKKKDGTWTGMIGALQRREIDVGKNFANIKIVKLKIVTLLWNFQPCLQWECL